jgi:hypothetical protein
MKFTVVWTPLAESQLAALWLSATDRAAITAAADQIDRMLSWNAHLHGESRSGKLRIAVVEPLGVEFEAIPDDRMVRILAVWSFQTSH